MEDWFSFRNRTLYKCSAIDTLLKSTQTLQDGNVTEKSFDTEKDILKFWVNDVLLYEFLSACCLSVVLMTYY